MGRREKYGYLKLDCVHPGHTHQKFSHKKISPVLCWTINDSAICYFLPSLIHFLSGLDMFPMLYSKFTFMFDLPNHLPSSMAFFILPGSRLEKGLKGPFCFFLHCISPIELGWRKFNFRPSLHTPSLENLHISAVTCNQVILKPLFLYLNSNLSAYY